jgi:hypothetical protein
MRRSPTGRRRGESPRDRRSAAAFKRGAVPGGRVRARARARRPSVKLAGGRFWRSSVSDRASRRPSSRMRRGSQALASPRICGGCSTGARCARKRCRVVRLATGSLTTEPRRSGPVALPTAWQQESVSRVGVLDYTERPEGGAQVGPLVATAARQVHDASVGRPATDAAAMPATGPPIPVVAPRSSVVVADDGTGRHDGCYATQIPATAIFLKTCGAATVLSG